MKNAVVNILSELFMFAMSAGIVFVFHPELPLLGVLIGALAVYVFSTVVYGVIQVIILLSARAYYHRKESKIE